MTTVGTEALAAVAGIVLVWWGGRTVAAARPALRRVLAAARDSADPTAPGGGFGRLTGTVDDPDVQTEAPFTGREVVAFDGTVEEGEDPVNADVVRTERQVVPFHLAVDGATVRVAPDDEATGARDAPVDVEPDATIEVPGGEQPPERIRSYNEWADLAPQRAPADVGGVDLSGGRTRTYREGVVEPGDPVTVYGRLEAPAGTDGDDDGVDADLDGGDDGVDAVLDGDVDAVLDGAAGGFLVTDREGARARLRAERRSLVRAALGVAAFGLGLGLFAFVAG